MSQINHFLQLAFAFDSLPRDRRRDLQLSLQQHLSQLGLRFNPSFLSFQLQGLPALARSVGMCARKKTLAQAEVEIGTVNPNPPQAETENGNTRPNRDGYRLGLMKWPRNGFVEMSFFLEGDENGDRMAGSSTEERGERAGENGRKEKGKKGRERKKSWKWREGKKKKKNLKVTD